MTIIKLDAIDSTNSFLRKLSLTKNLDDFTAVMADFQTEGKGQMGAKWTSDEGKNLMVSIFKKISFLDTEKNFFVSMVVSLSIFKAMEVLQIPKLKIKWPNDILSENKKIAGILIENVIKQGKLQVSIIGIGLNVNQTEFENLPKASSLRLISGRVWDKDEVLQEILKQMKNHFELLVLGSYSTIKMAYGTNLFRKDQPSTFKDENGAQFSGIILGVTDTGNLQVQLENRIIKEFQLKELRLLY